MCQCTRFIKYNIVKYAKTKQLTLTNIEHYETLPGHGIKATINNKTLFIVLAYLTIAVAKGCSELFSAEATYCNKVSSPLK
jgi:cation transport ATPase